MRSAAILVAALAAGLRPLPAAAYEGFGAVTQGGAGRPAYVVNSLSGGTGPGTLRDAISQGSRYITFSVGGTITVDGANSFAVTQSFLTISGCSAPAPGITISGGGGFFIQGGAHDVILECIRVRNGVDDNIRVWNAHNVVISRVSSAFAYDGNIDVTASHDVTVEWSILGPHKEGRNQLLSQNQRVSVHHNLYYGSDGRNPLVSGGYDTTPAPGLSADVRNNLIVKGYNGSAVSNGGKANIVKNYFQGVARSIIVNSMLDPDASCASILAQNAQAYVFGNESPPGDITCSRVPPNNPTTPYAFAPITEQTPCAAAVSIRSGAGTRPLDARDLATINDVVLSGCPSPPPPAPMTVGFAAPSPNQVVIASGIVAAGAPRVDLPVTIKAANAVKVELSRDAANPNCPTCGTAFYTWNAPTSGTDTYSVTMCANCFYQAETLPRTMILHAVAYDAAGGKKQADVSVAVTNQSGAVTDVNGDGATNITDVQLAVVQTLGLAACATGDVNRDGACSVSDVQLVVNMALGT